MDCRQDEVRDSILRYLYSLRERARGPKSLEVGVKELQAALKDSGIKQAEIIANLDYLVQKGWVNRVVVTRPFKTPKGFTTQNEKVTYKLSDVGVDRLEGASAFRREDRFSGINVTTISGVTVIGTGNVVNTGFAEVSNLLEELEKGITAADIREEDKLNAIAEIGTIQNQLTKPEPSMSIIKLAWISVERIVTAAGLVELGGKIATLLGLMP